MHLRFSTCLLLLMAFLFPVHLSADTPTTAERPRTALVLGGGGARGAAHIGVLEILERERIPFDCIVGTSMGGLVAGAYAAGLSPQDMRDKLADADWTNMFLDAADYSQLSYHTKRVTQGLLPGSGIRLSKEGLHISSGLVSGEKIKLFFNHLVGDDLGGQVIEDLNMPIALVATNISSGQKVVITEGSLTHAMRASMSVPGFMAPVDYGEAKLVDGGLVDNVPIQTGRELCAAERVIAVNVGSPLKPAEDINSLLDVTLQMLSILTQQNVLHSASQLNDGDIYITPILGDLTAAEFARYAEAADLGRTAAEEQLSTLQTLQVSPEDYAHWQSRHQKQREPINIIDTIAVNPTQVVNPSYIRQLIRQKEGEPLNREQLEIDLIRIYGIGGFENVDYQVSSVDGRNQLTILAKENTRSNNYLNFGFSLNQEWQEGSSINIRTAFRKTWLNTYGGEFFALLDFGNRHAFELNYYQPLNARQTWFVEPSYVIQRNDISIYINDRKVTEYDLKTDYTQIMLGRNFSIFGQARIGWRQYYTRGNEYIGIPDLPSISQRYDGWVAETVFDRRNRLYFPSRGWSGGISYFASGEQDYQKVRAELTATHAIGDYVIGMRTTYATVIDDNLPLLDAELLGGFLNLSGYATNQIWTNGLLYTHLRTEKIVGRMPLGMNGDLRMGFALEVARLDNPINMDREKDWLDSGVIYFGGETPIGPVYLGFGFTSEKDVNFYIQLGAF